MARTARTEGLAKLRATLLARLPSEARAEMRKANEKSADDFMQTIRKIIPEGDAEAPELIDTLAKQNVDEVAVEVSIGGPSAPYPLHLEAGHKARDGSHVPPKPFWNPAKRVVSKRHKGRAARALRKAIQTAAGGA